MTVLQLILSAVLSAIVFTSLYASIWMYQRMVEHEARRAEAEAITQELTSYQESNVTRERKMVIDLVRNLAAMPEEQRETYLTNYERHALSRRGLI